MCNAPTALKSKDHRDGSTEIGEKKKRGGSGAEKNAQVFITTDKPWVSIKSL